MKEKIDITKMEFLLTLNDNIVVQRYFNVKDYNPNTKNSIELYNVILGTYEKIHYSLKDKSHEYLVDNYYQIIENPESIETSNTDGPEGFNVFIKVNDLTICHRGWDAKVYPPKIRYTVDVRPHLKSILKQLTDIFSEKNLSHEYLGYLLV